MLVILLTYLFFCGNLYTSRQDIKERIMYTLGVDIGSTTSKAVILEGGENIVASSIVIATVGTAGVEEAVKNVLNFSKLELNDIKAVVATGYGRMNYDVADYKVSELTCHALGVHKEFPNVRTVIDIGGQDAKVISLAANGKMTNFVMNDKCAAGTGRFLDVMANILNLDIQDLEVEALKSDNPANISSTCTVFAESEVISQLATGRNIPDLVAGICKSVAIRVAALAKRVGVVEEVCMSGGVAKNSGVRNAMSKELGVDIVFSKNAQLMGALGAAIYGFKKL